MALNDQMERKRQIKRKYVRLACRLELLGAGAVTSNTQDLDPDSLFLGCNSSAFTGGSQPRIGMPGLITLEFKQKAARGSLKIRCHVNRIDPGGMAIALHYSELSADQQDAFLDLLESL